MTVTETEAFEVMVAQHRALEEGVRIRVAALVQAVRDGDRGEQAGAQLAAYLAGEVLPHVQAEEQTIYRVARGRGLLAAKVDEMMAEHRTLVSAVGRLAGALGDPNTAWSAEQIALLFSAHMAKENDILLPALAADEGVDLAGLLAEMRRLIAVVQEDPVGDEVLGTDLAATLLSLVLEAGIELARAGRGDRACRIEASAWAALRVPRPELVVRATAALHRVTRLVEGQPVVFRLAADSGDDDGDALADPHLDVRVLAPAQRHQSIFAAYGALASGGGFVLVNDHDPKPLRYQFEAEHADQFTWDYLESGPSVWRVRIGRVSTP